MKTFFLVIGLIPFGFQTNVSHASQEPKNQWIRPSQEGRLIWGIKGGIVLAVWPSGFQAKGMGGPRGLFRVGYERDGKMILVNFIAVEPVVADKRGFSELELSSVISQNLPLRQRRGKFIFNC